LKAQIQLKADVLEGWKVPGTGQVVTALCSVVREWSAQRFKKLTMDKNHGSLRY
jgi:hypothetical protein